MAVEYCLYLDESGDFDQDLLRDHRNECIVGGFIVNKSALLAEYELDNRMINVWVKCFPEQKNESRNQLLERLHHATELKREEKALPMFHMLNMISTLGDFVIFENYQKSMIIDSTITYANILADGITQLLISLVLKNNSTPVKLNVVAGFRRDMTKEGKQYIDLSVLKSRIEERMKLLEIRNESLRRLKTVYNIELGNDKRNSYLIACDYVCNFYFKRDDEIYKQKTVDEEETLHDALMKKYKSRNVFSLKGNAENEQILHGIQNNAYGSLLYDIAIGLIEDRENVENVINSFIVLPGQSRQIHLSTLGGYIKEILDVRRDLTLGERMLNFADSLIAKLRENNKENLRFSLDVLLYKLALENHKGNLVKMEKLFVESRALLPELLQYSENLDLAFIYLNRYAVFLIDSFAVDEAYDLLEKTIEHFDGYELIGDDLLDTVGLPMKKVNKSHQLGRLLGTQVQAAGYLLKQGRLDYSTAETLSEKAVENFTIDSDKLRQYQYRALIEGYAGNYEEARSFLLKGLDINSFGEPFNNPSSPKNMFCLYHLSTFLYNFRNTATSELRKIAKLFSNNLSKFWLSGYPGFIICANLGSFYTAENDIQRAKKFFKQAIMFNQNEQVLFKMLKLMIHCDYVECLRKLDDKDLNKEVDAVNEIRDALLNEGLTSAMKGLLDDFAQMPESEKYEWLAHQRQY